MINKSDVSMFTLSDALEAIKHKPEFVCKDKGGYSVIDYNLNTRDTFVGTTEAETLILLNLRGTAFDNQSGEIIRLGYDKFFNYGEYPEKDKNLDFDYYHLITKKLDGSAIFPIYAKEETVLGTRAGVTDVSKLASTFVESSDIKYMDFISMCKNQLQATPIFEFCSRKNRVVIDYPEDKLVLTSVRYISSGSYVDYENMLNLAKYFNVPVVERVDSILAREFEVFQKAISDLIGEEGVVIRFEAGDSTGHMLKMKASAYCLQHKALDQLRFAKDVLLLSLENMLDDIYPLLSDDTANRVRSFSDDFQHHLLELVELVHNEYVKYSDLPTQKEFAMAIMDNQYKQFLFGMKKGHDLTKLIKEYAKKQCNTISVCEDMQKFLNMTVKY